MANKTKLTLLLLGTIAILSADLGLTYSEYCDIKEKNNLNNKRNQKISSSTNTQNKLPIISKKEFLEQLTNKPLTSSSQIDECIVEASILDETQTPQNRDFPAIPNLTPLEYTYFYKLYIDLDKTHDHIVEIIKEGPTDDTDTKNVLQSNIDKALTSFNQSKDLNEFLYKLEEVLLLKDEKMLFETPQNPHQFFDITRDCVTPNEYLILYTLNNQARFIDGGEQRTLNSIIQNFIVINQPESILVHPTYCEYPRNTIRQPNKAIEFAKKYLSEYFAHPKREDYLSYLAQRIYNTKETPAPIIHKTHDELNTDDYKYIQRVLHSRFGNTPYWDLVVMVENGKDSEAMQKSAEKFIQRYLQTPKRSRFFKDLEMLHEAQKSQQQKQTHHQSTETLKTTYIAQGFDRVNS